jgi:hypothetical protein
MTLGTDKFDQYLSLRKVLETENDLRRIGRGQQPQS